MTATPTAILLPRGITRRGDKYIVRLNVGMDAGGKRVRHYYTCDTLPKAEAKLKEITRRKDDGERTLLSRQTLGQWLEEYVDTWCLKKAPRTRRDLRTSYATRVPPVLRATKLRALTPTILQAWVAALVARGLGPRSVAKAHAEVRAALAEAVKQGKLTRNPAAGCVLPPKARVERPWLSQEQAAAFLTAAEGDPLHAFFVLALATACRPSELYALQWGDLSGDLLTVQRAVSIDEDDEKIMGPTKTKTERQVPLPPSVLGVLKRHRLALGMPGDEVLMFPNADGGTLDGRNVANRHLKPLLEQAKLPTTLRLYDLRHSALSILAERQVDPKVIQELAGHSKIQTTYDTYIHSRPEQKRAAVAHLGQLVAVSA